MGKQLRIGFAMGGGVSMGTFSGAALSESIKLILLFGGYTDDSGTFRRYEPEDIVIDVFSGASAGGMSLLIMLRGLVRQEEQLKTTFDTRQHLANWLALHGLEADKIEADDPKRYEALLAAQYVQDLQEAIWADEICIERLLSDRDGNLTSEPSIFNRHALEEICASYVSFDDGNVEVDKRKLLADRVLFTCTLANLTPLIYNARDEPGLATDTDEARRMKILFGALGDGMTSKSSKDMRVFDIRFTGPKDVDFAKDEENPKRWFRLCAGQKQTGAYGSLTSPKAWARLCATAIACGCFPSAFEPVVLPRMCFEYRKDVWENLFKGFSTGPAPGICDPDENRTTASDVCDIDQMPEVYPFTYIDGGTFNNEPIREAYRMASFMDAQLKVADQDFERLIIFVDPSTSEPRGSMNLPFHADIDFRDPSLLHLRTRKQALERRSLSKLAALLPSAALAIVNEGRVVEADKIHKTRRKFDLRAQVRYALLQTPLQKSVSDDLIQEVAAFCVEQLASTRENTLIPTGRLTLKEELQRVAAEIDDDNLLKLLNNVSVSVSGVSAAASEGMPFIQSALTTAGVDKPALYKALCLVAIDIILDVEGKPQHQRFVAIAPVDIVLDERKNFDPNHPEPSKLHLLGEELAAFAGFMSREANRESGRAARQLAAKYLWGMDIIDGMSPGYMNEYIHKPYTPIYDTHQVRKEIARRGKAFSQRVRKMVTDSYIIDIVPGLDQFISGKIGKMLEGAVDDFLAAIPPKKTYTLRIYVPSGDYHLDLPGWLGSRNNQYPLGDESGRPFLPLQLTYTPAAYGAAASWEGDYLDDTGNYIIVSGSGGFEVQLPMPELVERSAYYPGFHFEMIVKETMLSSRIITAANWTIACDGFIPLEDELLKRMRSGEKVGSICPKG
jgi:predicted acylesterase/phospholipase RssA